MERDFNKLYHDKNLGLVANFPNAKGGKFWRGFVKTTIICLIGYLLVKFLVSKYAHDYLYLVLLLEKFVYGFLIFAILGLLNNIRSRWAYFERNVVKNDNLSVNLKKEIIKLFDLDSISKPILSKDSDKRDLKDQKVLDMISKIKNMSVLVNERQGLNHKVNRYYVAIIEYDHKLEEEIEKEIFNQSKSTKDTKFTRNCKQAMQNIERKNITFSAIKRMKNGNYYVEAKEVLGNDKWYYDKELTKLRNFKRQSEMEHSIPYRPCRYKGIDFTGFVNHEERNQEKERKARKWLDENIESITDILLENEIDVQIVLDSIVFRQSTAEIDFTIPSNLKVGSGDKQLMEIADLIDQTLDVKGSSIKIKLDTLHLSLAIPNGRTRDDNPRLNDNGEIEDFTKVLNLEDVFRELFG